MKGAFTGFIGDLQGFYKGLGRRVKAIEVQPCVPCMQTRKFRKAKRVYGVTAVDVPIYVYMAMYIHMYMYTHASNTYVYVYTHSI